MTRKHETHPPLGSLASAGGLFGRKGNYASTEQLSNRCCGGCCGGLAGGLRVP